MTSGRHGRCTICDRRQVALANKGLCWRCYGEYRKTLAGEVYYRTWWRQATVRIYQLRAARRLPLFKTIER